MYGYEDKPFLMERIVVALSYVTMGFVGFIWLIFGMITNSPISVFSRYHVFQSIFLSIAYFLLCLLCDILVGMFSVIPFVNVLVSQMKFYLNAPIFGPYSLIQAVVFGIVAYLTVTSFMGLYSRVPYVSDIINQNIGRY